MIFDDKDKDCDSFSKFSNNNSQNKGLLDIIISIIDLIIAYILFKFYKSLII